MSAFWDNAIRAVTLDAGGTLLEPWPSVGQVYADAAREVGFGCLPPAEVNRRFLSIWRERGEFDYSRAAWARVVAAAMNGLVSQADSPELFDSAWQRFAEGRSWRVFPDVRPALDALASLGLRLAVVSNWDERLIPLLHDLGLAHYFEFILPSVSAPGPKPDARIFEMSVQRLGLPPNSVLHVGDSAPDDLDGARSAGLSALLLDRATTQPDPNRISSLMDLVDRWTLARGHSSNDLAEG